MKLTESERKRQWGETEGEGGEKEERKKNGRSKKFERHIKTS